MDLRSQSLARNAENAAHELEQRISEVNDDTKQNHKQIILAEKRIVGSLSDLEQRINVTSAQADGFQTFQREVRNTLVVFCLILPVSIRPDSFLLDDTSQGD